MSNIKVRRLKKRIVNNKIEIIFIIFFLILFLVSTSYAFMNTTSIIDGGATILTKQDNNCKYNITASYDISNYWQQSNKYYYTYNLVIVNNGTEAINGWKIDIAGPSDLALNYGNVKSTINADNSLTFENMEWNGTIGVNEQFKLEFNIYSVEQDFKLTKFKFNGCSLIDEPNIPNSEEEDPIPLTGLTITPASYEMSVSEEITLQITKTPANANSTITWTSSDSTIATVDDSGKVIAIKEGTTTITASSGNIKSTSSIIVKQTEHDEPETYGLKFDFERGYATGNTFQFSLNITNNTDRSINSFSFDWDLPIGTNFSFWNDPGVNVDGITFNVKFIWSDLTPGKKELISGVVTLPVGYNAEDITNNLKFKNIKY